MKTFNIACVIGTRPEALKMLPVISALKQHDSFSVKTIVSGQHRELLEQMLKNSNLNVDVNFDVMLENQSLHALSANLFIHFEKFFKENPCDLVIAQGDTTTTLVAALSSFYKNIPFAHVEAGLRTPSVHSPFPEEFNRRTVSIVSSLHFCPTQHAANNLNREGIQQHVLVTGNTIIDTLLKQAETIPPAPPSSKKTILVTCHRRENFGEPLKNICKGLQQVALRNPGVEIIFPVHPNPNLKSVVFEKLSGIQNIHLCEPMDYNALITTMKHSTLILTDSGGLQEEAPALNKPVLVLRTETERPEGVEIGASRLVGHHPDLIVEQVEKLLFDEEAYLTMSQAGSPYGDGKASERIVTAISAFLEGGGFVKSDGVLNTPEKLNLTVA